MSLVFSRIKILTSKDTHVAVSPSIYLQANEMEAATGYFNIKL